MTTRKTLTPHVYRVRRYVCFKAGGSNYYYHADIPAMTAREAIKKAKTQGHSDVCWRCIDEFDSSPEPYSYVELLYRLTPRRASV